MENFQKDFPIYKKEFNRKKIVYFDSAATTLKPKKVISRIVRFYEHETSNIARGNHFLAEQNTFALEEIRSKTASFIKAKNDEIAFTQNCSDSINIVANSLNLKAEDEVIVSIIEHHSNFLPWKLKSIIKIVDIDQNGIIDLNQLEKLINVKTKLIAISYASNVTGNIQPIKEIINIAKRKNILVLIDAAQIVGHFSVNVKELDCDFMAFSSHKMLGPSGVGILYVKKEVQHLLHIIKAGGGSVQKVTLEKVNYKPFPHSIEIGTYNIEGILGFGAALDYINEKGFSVISKYLQYLEEYLKVALLNLDFINIFLISKKNHLPIFTIIPKNPNASISYLSRILSNSHKIIVRTGFQCCQLLYEKFHLSGGIRISLHIYNTKKEIDKFIKILKKLKPFF